MKTKSFLLSGIAALAIAGATPSFAQVDPTQSATEQAVPMKPVAMTHASHHRMARQTARRHMRVAISRRQESTPEEKAETDRLNEQQLQVARNADAARQAALSAQQAQAAAGTPN